MPGVDSQENSRLLGDRSGRAEINADLVGLESTTPEGSRESAAERRQVLEGRRRGRTCCTGHWRRRLSLSVLGDEGPG